MNVFLESGVIREAFLPEKKMGWTPWTTNLNWKNAPRNRGMLSHWRVLCSHVFTSRWGHNHPRRLRDCQNLLIGNNPFAVFSHYVLASWNMNFHNNKTQEKKQHGKNQRIFSKKSTWFEEHMNQTNLLAPPVSCFFSLKILTPFTPLPRSVGYPKPRYFANGPGVKSCAAQKAPSQHRFFHK